MIISIGAVLSAILYRLGGMNGMNTKFRDFGCPAVFIGVMCLSGNWSWFVLLSGALMFGALCTYWDWLFGEQT